jgi:hypothetical protein
MTKKYYKIESSSGPIFVQYTDEEGLDEAVALAPANVKVTPYPEEEQDNGKL